MLRTTLAAAILAGVAVIGTGAMAESGEKTKISAHIPGAVAVVADNAAPAPKDPLSTEQAEKFRQEVREGKHKSANAKINVEVGTVLPDDIEFYAMGSQWNMSQYKYALINDKTVIVDPKSRKIVQVLDAAKDVTSAKKGTADH